MLLNVHLMNSDMSLCFEFQIQSRGKNCMDFQKNIFLDHTHLFQNINIPKSKASVGNINGTKHIP